MDKLKYWLIVLSILGLDQQIKKYIEEQPDEAVKGLKPGRWLLLRRCHNQGMMLNLAEKSRPVVAVLSVVFTLVLTILFISTLGKKGGRWLRSGLALMLGGAFSNTYDRLKRKYVVDYFSFNVRNERLRNIVFNIADLGIMIGSLLVVIAGAE